ncbi:MAG: hydroxyethylthiazole kinase [Burkholderiales bacterium]|nr:hydroxyethylthiazole kinase [Burkholderiales bacterium]
MLISPPFLLARGANDTEDAWIDQCMPGGEPGGGAYPLSFNLGWHGGMHINAPTINSTVEPVRAISDGKVVFKRDPTPQPAGPLPEDHPQAYNGGWTDNGVVVIEHNTEIGEGENARVKFFSIYMHLSAIDAAISTTANEGRIHRKAIIGQAGQVYGGADRCIHLEIACDDTNLSHLVGRTEGPLNTGADGRTDAIFGEMYVALPAGTPVYGQEPLAQSAQAMMQPPTPRGQPQPPAQALEPAHTTGAELIVGIRYAGGDRVVAGGGRGDARITTYLPDGQTVGTTLVEPNAEYELYNTASRISMAYPAGGRPAPSAVYELLRFGRVIGPDALNPADVPHWRQVRHEAGQGWVNLNAPGLRKFSDADFAHWQQWRLVDDSADQDSRCDSALLRGWLDADGNGRLIPAEAQARLNDEGLRVKLARTICKFATEWDAATIDTRWGWLKQPSDENPNPLSEDEFKKLRAHITALAFWPGGMDLPQAHWRFQPREFVRWFRRCGWLDEDELVRVYPDSQYPVAALAQVGLTPSSVRERYRQHLNRVTGKYLVAGPSRRTHFFGQGAVESMCLALMIEGAADFRRNPRHASFASEANGYYDPPAGGYLDYLNGRLGNIEAGDGPKFRGRGMKQLTGRENYSKYWVYRGWLDRGSFQSPWWGPARPARAPQIADPERLSVTDYNAIDAGGWYWEAGSTANQFRSINGSITEGDAGDAAVERVTRAINGGVNGLAERRTHTARIYKVLSDVP